MYEHFYNLSAEPFRLSPDHRFCYCHEKYAKAKAYMAYAFMRAEGFVLITGEPGTGKTTLAGDIIESLADENVAVAKLVSTQLAADDLLRMIAFAFDVNADVVTKSIVLQHLTAHFLNLYRGGGRALLIVDEAQDLTPQALEELRLLTNLQEDGQPLLQIFLLGQPALQELVHTPGLEQMHQRIVAASEMRALGADETRAYVEHRLQVVGWRNDPAISAAVYPIIHLFSDGVPRRINLICSRLFLHSCVEQRHQVRVEDARTVVEELQEEQLSTRNILHHELFYAEDEFDLHFPDDACENAVVDAGISGSAKESIEGPLSGTSARGVGASQPPHSQSDPQVEELEDEGDPVAPEILRALMDGQSIDIGPSGDEPVDDDESSSALNPNQVGRGIEQESAPGGAEGRVKKSPAIKKKWTLFGSFCFSLAVLLTIQMNSYCGPETQACESAEPLAARAAKWLRHIVE